MKKIDVNIEMEVEVNMDIEVNKFIYEGRESQSLLLNKTLLE